MIVSKYGKMNHYWRSSRYPAGSYSSSRSCPGVENSSAAATGKSFQLHTRHAGFCPSAKDPGYRGQKGEACWYLAGNAHACTAWTGRHPEGSKVRRPYRLV